MISEGARPAEVAPLAAYQLAEVAMSNWSQIALEGWVREVLSVQTKDASVALPDGREAAVCLRGDSVVLVAYDDESTVLAKVRMVPA